MRAGINLKSFSEFSSSRRLFSWSTASWIDANRIGCPPSGVNMMLPSSSSTMPGRPADIVPIGPSLRMLAVANFVKRHAPVESRVRRQERLSGVAGWLRVDGRHGHAVDRCSSPRASGSCKASARLAPAPASVSARLVSVPALALVWLVLLSVVGVHDSPNGFGVGVHVDPAIGQRAGPTLAEEGEVVGFVIPCNRLIGGPPSWVPGVGSRSTIRPVDRLTFSPLAMRFNRSVQCALLNVDDGRAHPLAVFDGVSDDVAKLTVLPDGRVRRAGWLAGIVDGMIHRDGDHVPVAGVLFDFVFRIHQGTLNP